jgi:4-amino-4-deoxy-L-arabinose transferase-like glycosyltransferase
MLFSLSLLLYVVAAVVLCAAVFKKLSISNLIITFYLAFFCGNIIVELLLHFFKQLNNVGLFLAIQAGFCLLACAAALLIAKPEKDHFRFDSYPVKEKGFAFSVILIALIALCFVVLLIIGSQTPPNNLDSLHTHLNRIYYWLQHGSFAVWPATSDFQITYPMNANMQGLWVFLLTGNENLYFLASWFSLITICAVIFKIGTMFHLSANRALIGSLVFLSVPAATLQAYSFQNDLVVTALIAITILGIFSYRQSKYFGYMLIGALALALALGVKQTAFMVLPAILLLLVFFAFREKMLKAVLKFVLALTIFSTVFSSFKYVQNVMTFGSFFGTSDLISGQEFSIGGLLDKARYNVPRYLFNFFSTDGLPEVISSRLLEQKGNVFSAATGKIGLDLEKEIFLAPGYDPTERFLYNYQPDLVEDTSWFGVLSSLLILISIVVVFCQKDKRRSGYLLFSLIFFASYFAAILLQRPGWDPYQGRYFILSLFPFFPLLGVYVPERRFWRGLVVTAILGIWTLMMFTILLMNGSKPIITAGSVTHWQNTVLKMPQNNAFEVIKKNSLLKVSEVMIRVSAQKAAIFDEDYYGQLFYSASSRKKSIELVNQIIPSDQPIYLLTYRDPLEYALFGKNQTRNLYPLSAADEVPNGAYLLVDLDDPREFPGFTLLGETNLIRLYQRSE